MHKKILRDIGSQLNFDKKYFPTYYKAAERKLTKIRNFIYMDKRERKFARSVAQKGHKYINVGRSRYKS